MTEGGQTNEGAVSTGVDRRQLLKGAAAVGVGAAAWAVPNITSMGGTPAYADSCTAGSTLFPICQTNTSCSCESTEAFKAGGVDYAIGTKVLDYKPCKNTACVGPTFDGSATINVDQSGTCAAGSNPEGASTVDGTANVTVKPKNTSLFCRGVVRIYAGGQCSGANTQFNGEIKQGNSTLFLPLIPCSAAGTGGNIFLSVFVECSSEKECLV